MNMTSPASGGPSLRVPRVEPRRRRVACSRAGKARLPSRFQCWRVESCCARLRGDGERGGLRMIGGGVFRLAASCLLTFGDARVGSCKFAMHMRA